MPGHVSSVGVPAGPKFASEMVYADSVQTKTLTPGDLMPNLNVLQSGFILLRCLTEDAEYEVKLVLHSRSGEKGPPSDHFVKDAAHAPEGKERTRVRKHIRHEE